MFVSRFAVGLLLVSCARAFWRLPCAKPCINARIDPIVDPGRPSAHLHTIMGSGAISPNATFADLRMSTCSTCKVKDDQSNYWIPDLMYEHKNGSFEAVDHGGMLVYYLQRNQPGEKVHAFPDGLHMVTGNPFIRNDTGYPGPTGISWACMDFNGPGHPQTPCFSNMKCPNGLRAQVFFQSCWNGKDLDSPNHMSHMAYPDRIDNGICPSTHPVRIVSIFYEVWFNVAPFNALNDGGRFVLSTGDSTGCSLHGDFKDGWNKDVLQRAIDQCTAPSGVIEDCPVFKNEGRFYTDNEMNACSAKNPFPGEKEVSPGQLLPYLPGCLPVTNGPEPAKPGVYVPGCKALGVPGGGSGVVAPSSAHTSASMPSASSKPKLISLSSPTTSLKTTPTGHNGDSNGSGGENGGGSCHCSCPSQTSMQTPSPSKSSSHRRHYVRHGDNGSPMYF